MFKENYMISGEIYCETGLHIGGSNDAIDIGGSDNVVIRDSVSGLPFIPGSSLKGKLRSLLELSDKTSAESVIANRGQVCTDDEAVSTQIFGSAADNSKLKFPTRIIVRDAFPTEETKELWKTQEDIVKGTELKWENVLNRIDSSANPRNIERVPKGSSFNFEIVFSVYEDDSNNLPPACPVKIGEFDLPGCPGVDRAADGKSGSQNALSAVEAADALADFKN